MDKSISGLVSFTDPTFMAFAKTIYLVTRALKYTPFGTWHIMPGTQTNGSPIERTCEKKLSNH